MNTPDPHDSVQSAKQTPKMTELEMLDEVIGSMYANIRKSESEPKVADFLRALDLKRRLRLTKNGKKKLVDVIDNVRGEELDKTDETEVETESD